MTKLGPNAVKFAIAEMICQLHPSVHGHCWDIFLLWKMVIATTKIQKTLLWKGKCRCIHDFIVHASRRTKMFKIANQLLHKDDILLFLCRKREMGQVARYRFRNHLQLPCSAHFPSKKIKYFFFLKVSAKNKWRFQVCIYFWSATFQNQIPRSWFFSTLQPNSAVCLKSPRPPQSDYSCKIHARKSSKNRNHQIVESTLKLNVQLQTSPARPCLLVFAFANSYLALADDPHHTRTLSQIWIIKKKMMHSGSLRRGHSLVPAMTMEAEDWGEEVERDLGKWLGGWGEVGGQEQEAELAWLRYE